MQKSVAFIIHNLILFETIKPLLEELKKNQIEYDIYVPQIEEDDWKEMSKDTFQHLLKNGHDVKMIEEVPDKNYKIAFYPYLPYYIEVNADYKVRYQYGMAKPTWNLDTWSVGFDYIFCNGTYDYSFLRAYAQCEITGFLKFARFNKKVKDAKYGEKYRLLYLPTYGKECSIEYLHRQLNQLRDKFDITIKLHHGTTFLEPDRVNIAKTITDNILDHKASLVELLENTDVVLTDGSGAIFDAIATDTPIVIFQPHKPEPFENIIALEQQILKDNIVPHCSNAEEIEQALLLALKSEEYMERRKKFSEQVFPVKGDQTLQVCMKEIRKMLSDEIDVHYQAAHKRLNRMISGLEEMIEAEKVQNSLLEEKLGINNELIGELSNNLLEKDNWLNQLVSSISEKDEALVNFNNLSLKKDEVIHELNVSLFERDKILIKLRNNIEKREEIIQELRLELVENKLVIQTLNSSAEDKDITIKDLTANILEKDLIIQDLTANNFEKDAIIQSIIAKNMEKDSIIQEFTNYNLEKDSMIQELTTKIAEEEKRYNNYVTDKESKIDDLNQTKMRLYHELNNIYNSKRWRVANNLKWILQKTGALYFLKAYSIWKKYGFGVLLKKTKSKLIKHNVTGLERAEAEQHFPQSKEEFLNWYEYRFLNYKHARNQTYGLPLSNFSVPYVKDLVSIILPVYNGEDMVGEAIESILKQSYKNFELIIINDGSKDGTPEIIDSYAQKDKRIKVVHQENRKIPRTLSRGFRMASGEFYTWTSADNNLHHNFLEKLVNDMKEDRDLGMVYANMRLIDDKGDLIINHGWYEEPENPSVVNLPKSTFELNVYPNNTIGAAFMYRAKVAHILEDYSIYKHTLEDYDYWMRVNSLFELKHASFDQPIYDYRFHAKSLTAQDKDLGITANRYKLMVLEDFRRDFYLSPLVWVVEGDDRAACDQFTQLIISKGHISLERDVLNSLNVSNLAIPVCYLYITSDSEHINKAPDDLPLATYRTFVLNTKAKALPKANMAELNWDMYVITNVLTELSPIPDYKGWFGVSDLVSMFSLIDTKVKNRQAYLIEGKIETEYTFSKKVSVILCTYKRSEKLVNALQAVIQQTLSKDEYEIIVVNNDYKNNEIELLVRDCIAEYALPIGFLNYTIAPIKGLSYARNVGMFAALGEVLLYVDDDAIADPTLVEETWNCFLSNPEVGVVGGNIILNLPEPRPQVVMQGLEALWSQLIVQGDNFIESKYQWEFPYGANFAVRNHALLRIGGFRIGYGRKGNDFAGGEEIVVSHLMGQIGYKVGLNPKSKVIHDVDISRYTKEHVQKTIRAGILTNYQLQKDLYAPMESNIDYDLSIIDNLQAELGVLKSKRASEELGYEIFYKEAQLRAYTELVEVKKSDMDKKRKIHS